MVPLSIAYIAVGSISAAVGILHLFIFFRRPDLKTDLSFSIVALLNAVSVFFELKMHHSASQAAYISGLKTTLVFQGLLWISFTWFIYYFTRSARKWAVNLTSAIYAAAVIINIMYPNSVLFKEVTMFSSFSLPWGERIFFVEGSPNPWRILPDIGWFFMLFIAFDSTVRMGRKGEKQRAVIFGIILFLCLGLGYLNGTLIDFGIIEPPSLFFLTFLGLILMMSFHLAGGVVNASVLTQEVKANDARWRNMLENIQLLAVRMNKAAQIEYVNPYFTKTTGYSANETVGSKFLDFISETDKEAAYQRFLNAMNGTVHPHSRSALVKKNGGTAAIAWSNVALHDAAGQPAGLLSIGEDVTALESARQELLDEKERMGTILSSLNVGLALIDADLNVLWVNEKTLQLYPHGNPVGQKCYAFAENRKSPCEDCGALEAFTDGAIHQRDLLNSTDNRWYHIVSLPVKDGAGNVVNVLESISDITEQKQMIEDRDQALNDLKKLKEKLEAENIALKELIQVDHGFNEIVGQSNAILYVLTKVQQVAETDAVVMIQGETGVGKGLFAKAVHHASSRADRPFVTVNCAALPSQLIESELFGHEEGAFTGAAKMRRGRFELADGGTLFLDEIGELPPEMQSKLLKAVQDHTFERVGGGKTFSVDVRIIAATNRNLAEEVSEGRFRADLYYRLNVYPITIPPLRQRRDDIPLLVKHFVSLFSKKYGKDIVEVPLPVMEHLLAYDWPGNVRELQNIIERAVITGSGPVLSLPEAITTLPETSRTETETCPPDLRPLHEVERLHILKALECTDWRISGPKGAAAILKLNPSTLRNRMKKHKLSRP